MIMAATGGLPPEADFIEMVGYSSLNPYFKSKIFRRFLIQYRQNGCNGSRLVSPPTTRMKAHAFQIRRKRMFNL